LTNPLTPVRGSVSVIDNKRLTQNRARQSLCENR